MKILIKNITENPASLLRRAGYTFQHQENPARNATHNVAGGGEMSFVRPLARSGFPRFHCYAKLDKISLILNVHLDQKRETYGDETRHHGEYGNDGPLADEAAFLLKTLGPNAEIISK